MSADGLNGTALVTGATGCTGRALCERLRSLGLRVTGWGTRPDDRSLTSLGVEYQAVDIREPRLVAQAFRGFDYVFHLAAAYRKEGYDQSVFREVNVTGTRHLLECAKESGVKRFLHTSTVGVQGEILDPPASEDYRTAPGDHYQRSKLEGEALALDFFTAGLNGTVVRPVGIYGPGDTRFLKLFRPISRGRFVMIGDGKPLYHLTYLDDLIDGILLACASPAARSEVFTIAGPRYTTLWELVHLVADTLDVPRPRWSVPYLPVYLASVLCDALGKLLRFQPPLYPRRVEFFKLDRAFSIEKAKRVLGFQPSVGLSEGLQKTADWYRSEGLI